MPKILNINPIGTKIKKNIKKSIIGAIKEPKKRPSLIHKKFNIFR